MKPIESVKARTSEIRPSTEAIARLDLIRHPYGPCPAVLESIEMGLEPTLDSLVPDLRLRLAIHHRIPASSIRMFTGIDSGIRRMIDSMHGPLVGFPPSFSSSRLEATWPNRRRVLVTRGAGRRGTIDQDVASDLPGNAIALVESPSDPLGAVLTPSELVRLARSCQFVFVDERYAEFAGQSLLPIAAEFDNVIVFRTFDIWSGLHGFPLAWAVGSPAAMRAIPESDAGIQPASVVAAMATLDELATVEATLRIVRDDRSRLYRLLRKFAFLEPVPSWAPFVTARISIGKREAVLDGLRERGVLVHAPDQTGLESYIRFGIDSRMAIDRLRLALLDLGPVILG